MSFALEFIEQVRGQFPALQRRMNGRDVAFFDGPAGTQVPQCVIDAIVRCLSETNANHGGLFATSQEGDRMLAESHQALADFLGADDPDTVSFGANMTSLTFALSRALARTWKAGDEIIVTRIDHDANVTPWALAARDAGATLRMVEFHREDCTLDLDDFRSKLSDRTRLVAVGCASNASGSIHPVREITAAAQACGAQVFLDAVHYAPHALVDVQEFGCDYLACSAYKFFGPHVGILWGRRELLAGLEAYKLRPAPNDLPGKWMTGTQSHEAIAGAAAAVDYLADLGRGLTADPSLARRAALEAAYREIGAYERALCRQLLAGLREVPGLKIWGITDPARLGERFATVSLTHDRFTPAEMARRLGEQGLFAWHGNYYALNLSEALGHEPHGMLRIGLVHYNTTAEVERLLAAFRQF